MVSFPLVCLLGRNVRLTSQLPVDDVQRRLAEYTIDWGGDFYGRSVPGPPWETSRFTACQGMASFWLGIPLAVSGSVEADGASTVLTAVIRPHGSAFAKLTLVACFFLVTGALRGLLLPSVGLIVFFALAWMGLVWTNLAGKSRAIEERLAAACGPSRSTPAPR